MEIQVFKNEMFGEVRTLINEKGEPFFVGSDVAGVLGYSDPQKAVKMHVDDDDKLTRRIVVSGQNRSAIIINESGLYSLVLSSKMPQAKEFKHWVTSEVLPQIRQTGGYLPTRNPRTGEALTDNEIVEAANKILARTISRANLPADDCFTVSQMADMLGITANMLNHFLVDKGVQFWNGCRYKLKAKYADCGYDEIRYFFYHGLEGQGKQRPYMVWTPEGRDFVVSLFNK
ncbi:BRO family protein [Xylanibacter ruminicola]|uniref:Phage antirepressor protein KilAC domain-containing protein n=1 Tax=Xylanibacter ruminicola TaxID=839 RepID=A0A1M6VEZ5_XYLRU|nr:BRO family protein [Xylanibacter ruminicola]SHK79856.1 Phage antirepressor protein KilAC domain-containing protein [Xylanibacter ruminicola]